MKIKFNPWPLLIVFFYASAVPAQTIDPSANQPSERLPVENKIIEIRSYNLKPGSRNELQKLFIEQALPLLKKWKVDVVDYGPSTHDEDSWFLIRAYKNIQDRQESEDAFYGSDDWKKGPREAILSLIINYTTIVIPTDSLTYWSSKIKNMTDTTTINQDSEELSALNAQFIRNFLSQDAAAHSKIINRDFLCIESNGRIVRREEYLKNWATDFARSGYTTFAYQDESIRIFGNTALVRSKTVYTKKVNGEEIKGYSVYTDTYVKEGGAWTCVQAQITPVK
jgi:hypothetical protein